MVDCTTQTVQVKLPGAKENKSKNESKYEFRLYATEIQNSESILGVPHTYVGCMLMLSMDKFSFYLYFDVLFSIRFDFL